MNKILEKLASYRHHLWMAFTSPDEVSWLAHLAMVVSGTYLPALIVWLVWDLIPALFVAKILSEFWILFMAGREVVDYFRHLSMGHPKSRTIRDGIGDLIGPGLNYVLTWLIFAVASVRYLYGG